MSNIIELFRSSPSGGMPSPVEARHGRKPRSNHGNAANNADAIVKAIATCSTSGDHDPILEVERIVAIVLQTFRRLGRKPVRLQPLIAADLDRHCKRGDPTALLLRDWIAGRTLPSAGMEDEAIRRISPGPEV